MLEDYMTTRCVVVGLSLIASIGCDQADPLLGPDPTSPPITPASPVTPVAPPATPGTSPLLLVDLPAPLRPALPGRDNQQAPSGFPSIEAMESESIWPPALYDYFVSVGWNGSPTLDGYAFMSFYGNWAQQTLQLQIYRNGTLAAQNTWVETGSSIWPKQSGALTSGSLNAGISCGATGNGMSSHAVEVRIITAQSWSTIGRNNTSDTDVAVQAACPPPPTCTLTPQTSIASSARFRARLGDPFVASDFEQCSNPPPPGRGGGSGGSGSKGYVCYEVWLVYPDTGVEIYLGDVCYEVYAT